MKNKTAAFIFLCLFFVYVLLSLFNTLYWTPSYEGNAFVRNIGEVTDGEALEVIWIPGQLLAFFLSMIADGDVAIASAILTFAIGTFVIMRLFKISWSDLKVGRGKVGN